MPKAIKAAAPANSKRCFSFISSIVLRLLTYAGTW